MHPDRANARRLLVLAYRFPPQARVGAHRTTKFVRYLGQFGWHPVVHTVSNPHCSHYDETLSRQIPADVPVFRTPTVEIEALEDGLRAVRDLLRRRRVGGVAKSGKTPPPRAPGAARPSRLRDYVWRYWLTPDPQIVWLPGALARSLWIARRHGVSAVYSSSPPHSVQLVALLLRRRLGLPWIADMRDPWTEGLHRQEWYEGNGPRRRREERWEHAICREADRVVVATEGAQRALQTKYPETAHKISCITNGFDADDFAHVDAGRQTLEPGCLHVTLTGNVESAFDLLPLLRAIAAIVERRPEARRVLRFNFVGTKRRAECDAFLAVNGLEDVVRFRAPVPQPVALQILAESQVALIAAAERHHGAGVKISAKLFEYLYLRKPILALIETGVTTRILDEACLGFHAAPSDTAAIARRLDRFLDEFDTGGIPVEPNEAYIASFDRRRQSGRLAAMLDEISSAR